MTVGLPGVGIGGIFYLVSALTMPVRELVRTLRRESSATRWRFVMMQWSLAVGILIAMWLTGKAIGMLVTAVGSSLPSSGFARHIASRNVLQVGALALSLGTLTLVWVGVHALRMLLRLRERSTVRTSLPATTASGATVGREAITDERWLATGTRGLGVDSGQFRRSR
jgi:hypothetical protein